MGMASPHQPKLAHFLSGLDIFLNFSGRKFYLKDCQQQEARETSISLRQFSNQIRFYEKGK